MKMKNTTLIEYLKSDRVAVFCMNDEDSLKLQELVNPNELLIYAANKGLANDSVEYVAKSQIAENNAEILFLCGQAAPALINRKRYRHAKSVAIPLISLLNPIVFLGVVRYINRHLRFDGFLKIHRVNYLVFKILKRQQRPYRLWLNKTLGHIGFIRHLNEQKENYVVLRWHEKLPNWPQGDDLDILASDASAISIRNFLNSKIGNLPIDLYAVSGGDVSGGDTVAYFPPNISNRILSRSIFNSVSVRVPCPEDDYYSLLYHAIYHKGHKSGLIDQLNSTSNKFEYDEKFIHALEQKSDLIGVKFEPFLEKSENELALAGWRPPRDMLNHFALSNTWLKKHLNLDVATAKEGFAIFILRDIVESWNCTDEVLSKIKSAGFEIIDTWVIPINLRDDIASKIRGGNWSKGNDWPANGGLPAIVVSVFDPNPITPTVKEIKSAPAIRNSRILFKRVLRAEINQKFPIESRANFIHTSDNSFEALDYASILLPLDNKSDVNNYLDQIFYKHKIK